jgi:hypothetical protein
MSMSGRNTKRRTAVTSGANIPDFSGKVVIFYTSDEGGSHLLASPVFEMRAGRLFVSGRSPVVGGWMDGLAGAVAWDAVSAYVVYDSAEACEAAYKRRLGGTEVATKKAKR